MTWMDKDFTHLLVLKKGKFGGKRGQAFILDAKDFNEAEGIMVGTLEECEKYRKAHPERICCTHMTISCSLFEEKRWRFKRWFKRKARRIVWKLEDWIEGSD